MTSLSLTSTSPEKVGGDAVVVGVVAGPDGPALAGVAPDLEKAVKGGLAAQLAALGARGSREEVTRLATLGATKARSVVAVGLGERPDGRWPDDVLRRAAGAAVRSLAGAEEVAFALPQQDDPTSLRAVAEGAALGAYAFDRYRTADGSAKGRKAPVRRVSLVVPSARDKAAKAVLHRAEVVARAVHLARDLVNTPPRDLPPAALADAAVAEGRRVGVDVEVLDEDALRAGGYGGIVAVGQGSANPPRLVRMSRTTRKARTTVHLVGKGITFDSGGLSLKPAGSMEWMKSDMGGAAAVIAAVGAVAELDLPVDVVGWAACAENMPSGTAQRPSDVLTTYGGRTVEVLNTDAEGRLVLADALVRACEEEPDLLVDVATLTGAQLVALGSRVTGVMGDEDLRDRVVAAAERAGEPSWAMPLPEELRKGLDSDVADLKNIGGDRNAGMLLAAVFLREFVADGVPWAHLDIAGPAFNQGSAYGYTPKGGTGAAVRTFVELCEEVARRR